MKNIVKQKVVIKHFLVMNSFQKIFFQDVFFFSSYSLSYIVLLFICVMLLITCVCVCLFLKLQSISEQTQTKRDIDFKLFQVSLSLSLFFLFKCSNFSCYMHHHIFKLANSHLIIDFFLNIQN